MTGGSPIGPPVVLQRYTLTAAAEEAGLSRLYGGIHIQDGNLDGLTLGEQVAEAAAPRWDALFTRGGDDLIDADPEGGLIIAGSDDDTVIGAGTEDSIEGGSGNDILLGGAGNDTIDGGDDVINTGIGFDLVEAGGGDDLVQGLNGFDTLNGGAGTDVLRGGLGADTFVFRAGSGNDRVVDFGNVDAVEIEAALLGGGTPDPADLIPFATRDADGFLLLDFGGGDTLTFTGITNSAAILDDVSFI
ncbi:calcium-binding protein [Roseovarius sp. MBR-154]|jgi:Ca2+-binding RTX toxin-like protein